jgi:hypothetical protein
MFALKHVVPWGRSLSEYRRMFALSDEDLGHRILGCADGPAGFNAELTSIGGQVVSCDPIYRFTPAEIGDRIDETYQTVIEETRRNAGEFVWNADIPNVEALGCLRLTSMRRFLADYGAGKAAGRYVEAELPTLPFEHGTFDLAVCSHFLFLYSDLLAEDFHVESIRELCRVSREVRLFPLLELGSVPSRHAQAVAARLEDEGYQVAVERVSYEFQRGGNQMMRIRGGHD